MRMRCFALGSVTGGTSSLVLDPAEVGAGVQARLTMSEEPRVQPCLRRAPAKQRKPARPQFVLGLSRWREDVTSAHRSSVATAVGKPAQKNWGLALQLPYVPVDVLKRTVLRKCGSSP